MDPQLNAWYDNKISFLCYIFHVHSQQIFENFSDFVWEVVKFCLLLFYKNKSYDTYMEIYT